MKELKEVEMEAGIESPGTDSELKEVEVRIEFSDMDKGKLEHLFKAEQELRLAGITFASGYDFQEKRRDWEFDLSLKGARVKLYKMKGKKDERL